MKIKKDHFEHIEREIADYSHRCAVAGKPIGDHYMDYKRAGMSDKRFRWDVATAAGLVPFMCDYLYAYANDNHIDTALRTVAKRWED